MNMQVVRNSIFAEGTRDYLVLSLIESWIQQQAPQAGEEEIRELTLGLLGDLMTRGELEPGLPKGREFVPWEGTPSEHLSRIRQEWGGPGQMMIWFRTKDR